MLRQERDKLTPPQTHLTVFIFFSRMFFSLYDIKVMKNVITNNNIAPNTFTVVRLRPITSLFILIHEFDFVVQCSLFRTM